MNKPFRRRPNALGQNHKSGQGKRASTDAAGTDPGRKLSMPGGQATLKRKNILIVDDRLVQRRHRAYMRQIRSRYAPAD